MVAASPVFMATINSEFAFSTARSSLGSPEWCASNSAGTTVKKTTVARQSAKSKLLFMMLLLVAAISSTLTGIMHSRESQSPSLTQRFRLTRTRMIQLALNVEDSFASTLHVDLG